MQDINERLITAAKNGSDDEVNQCLDEGAGIDYVSHAGVEHCTALGFAIRGNHTSVVKTLLARGANCANALDQVIAAQKPHVFYLLI